MIRLIPVQSEDVKRVTCERCNSRIEYEVSDLELGEYGCPYIICPNCRNMVDVDDEDAPQLYISTIRYPRHFYKYSDSGISDTDDINRWIQACLKSARESVIAGDPASCFMGSGGVLVMAIPEDEGFTVYVLRGYEESYVPYWKGGGRSK